MKTKNCLTAVLVASLLLPTFARADFKARGSDSTLHVLKALAAAFAADTGKTITLEGGGSGAGVKGLESGDVSLAFLSRELSAAEKSAGLVGSVYAADGVAVIVHPTNAAANFTLAELKDIFTGKTEAWADGKPIILFNRNADSGTREVFHDRVLGKDAFSAKAMVKHDGVLLGSLAKLPGAIAYTSLGEVDEAKVRVVTVNGITPSAATLRDGTYPIGRKPTLATKGAATGDEKAFLDFVLGPKGQAVVAQSGLVPVK
ncbi:MAG: substrate-binding domain-containing protein [Opitutae bacterium]|nr:substrate-binding domain-containing protein [Opitutae bacterium]